MGSEARKHAHRLAALKGVVLELDEREAALRRIEAYTAPQPRKVTLLGTIRRYVHR